MQHYHKPGAQFPVHDGLSKWSARPKENGLQASTWSTQMHHMPMAHVSRTSMKSLDRVLLVSKLAPFP